MNIPNIMTLARVAIIPVVIGCFYIPNPYGAWIACGLFILAAITDFLDGWLARKLDQVSHFGRFLDPIADKLLVAAVLVMLSAEQRISILGVFFAIIILFRELLVSGLREYLAQLNVPMPVTKLAKWKTTVQFVALTILLLGDAGPWALPWAIIGEVFLALAAALTIITGWQYLSTGYRAMTAAEITRDH